MELTGGKIEYRQFARSLLPVLQDQNKVHRETALSEIWAEHMLVDKGWKLAINTQGHPYLLFDLESDPDERRNLAGSPEYRDIETTLRLKILERTASSHINEG